MIDLSGNQRPCQKPANFPFPIEGGFVTKSANGYPVICGGWKDFIQPLDVCYEYNPVRNEWNLFGDKMNEARVWAAAAKLPDGRVSITHQSSDYQIVFFLK